MCGRQDNGPPTMYTITSYELDPRTYEYVMFHGKRKFRLYTKLRWLILFFLRFYLFIFRERGREGQREKPQCVVVSQACPTGDLACNPGMCPLTGNQTDDPLVHWPALSPLSHTSQGKMANS